MRLIDADKLKKQLDTVYNEMANEIERKGLRLARWFLISAPTVSTYRPHGEWINVSDCWEANEKCSVCGEIVYEYDYNFCPNCGAKMGGTSGKVYDRFAERWIDESDIDPFAEPARYSEPQTDRPHGEWIHDTHYGVNLPEHKCSICGEWEYSDEESNFCPNCGARMTPYKGGDDE